MDFSLSEEQQLLLESLDEILGQYTSPTYVVGTDHEHHQPVEFKRAIQEAGFPSLGIPEEYGGTSVDMVTMCLTGERVASRDLNLEYATGIPQVLDTLKFGSPERCRSVLGILQDGGVPFALAFTGPRMGSDSLAMKATAEYRNGKVRFNGTKTFIANAVDARYLLTMAVNPGAEDPRRAISMYLVPTDTPGVRISPISRMYWHTADSSEIYYNDVKIDESCLIDIKGEGLKRLMKSFGLERIMTATQSPDLAEAAFKDAAEYAATRMQFGKPIGSSQLVQEKLTGTAIRIENTKSFIYRSALMVNSDTLNRKQAAMCKRYCSMAAFEVCGDALQVHGGIGVTEGVRIKRLWRDARGHRSKGGTDEIMVHIVGRQIVEEHTR